MFTNTILKYCTCLSASKKYKITGCLSHNMKIGFYLPMCKRNAVFSLPVSFNEI